MGNRLFSFKSPKDLCNYIRLNKEIFSQIIICEDVLVHTIYFYFTLNDGSFLGSYKKNYSDFYCYKKALIKLAKKINYCATSYKGNSKTLILTSYNAKWRCIN